MLMTSRILENVHPNLVAEGRHFKSQPVVGNSRTKPRFYSKPIFSGGSFSFSLFLALALQHLALLMKILH